MADTDTTTGSTGAKTRGPRGNGPGAAKRGVLGSPTPLNMVRAGVAEMVGTFFLVLVGTATATAATIGKSTAGAAPNSLAVALSFGLILVAIVAAIGQVSGAHVNPAVTLGLAVTKHFPWRYVPAYLAAQFAGAIIAALAVWAAYGSQARKVSALGAPKPVGQSTSLEGFLTEALIAFILVFVVLAVATDPRVPAGSAALAIGFALAAGVLLGGPVSGGAGNPARALGPDIVSLKFANLLAYLIGPCVGGIIGALLYQAVGKGHTPESAVADTDTKPGEDSPNERMA